MPKKATCDVARLEHLDADLLVMEAEAEALDVRAVVVPQLRSRQVEGHLANNQFYRASTSTNLYSHVKTAQAPGGARLSRGCKSFRPPPQIQSAHRRSPAVHRV